MLRPTERRGGRGAHNNRNIPSLPRGQSGARILRERTERRATETKQFYNNMDIEAFIHAIMERAPIWMSTHPKYKNKQVNKRMWEEIKEKFPDQEVEDLKKRWKNLKDAYRKELKKYPIYRTENVNIQSNWRYFESLSFVREEIGRTQEHNTADVQDDVTIQSASDNDTKEISEVTSTPGVAFITQPSPKPESTSPSEDSPHAGTSGSGLNKKRNKAANDLRHEYLEIERKKLKILERELERSESDKQDKKSDNYHFLMSILPDMDKLPPVQKMRLRNKINEAVLEEMNMLYGDNFDQFANITEPANDVQFNNIKKEQCETFYFTE